MAVNQTQVFMTYGLGGDLVEIPPQPIIAQRDPETDDRAQLGTLWVNTVDSTVWCLTSFQDGNAMWSTSPASGVGTFTEIEVDPGDIEVASGDVVIAAGNLEVTAGNAQIGGNLLVNGTITLGGDLGVSADSIQLQGTADAAQTVLITENGGTSGTVEISALQGTGADSVNINSVAGGITLSSGLASADAINIVASAGGIDMDSALLTSITSSSNNAQAILLEATAGGIDILASGAAAGEDIDIVATGSSVNITSTEATADAIVLNASNGGIDLLTGGGEITINAAGNVTMTPVTATVAGTSTTADGRVFVVTFTGLTTAASATETLTITNSALGAGDGIFCTVSNRGTNDAQMTLTRVNTQTAGTLIVQCENNGADALNGDIIVTGWIIN